MYIFVCKNNYTIQNLAAWEIKQLGFLCPCLIIKVIYSNGKVEYRRRVHMVVNLLACLLAVIVTRLKPYLTSIVPHM